MHARGSSPGRRGASATARDTGSLDDLVERFGDRVLPLKLDVTDRIAEWRQWEPVSVAAHGGKD